MLLGFVLILYFHPRLGLPSDLLMFISFPTRATYPTRHIFLNTVTGHVPRMGKGRRTYRVLVGKPEGRGRLGRLRCRWDDNIKMDLRELGWGHGLNRCGSGLGQMAGCCEYGNESSGSMKCGEFLDELRTC